MNGREARPMSVQPLDLSKLRVYPLSERRSLSRADEILIDPEAPPGPCPEGIEASIDDCAARVRDALWRGAAGMLIYGAHLLRNGTARIVGRMLEHGWLTHLATNGAGS